MNHVVPGKNLTMKKKEVFQEKKRPTDTKKTACKGGLDG